MQSRVDEKVKELASLMRLIAFARQNAVELDADISAYCLELALDALKQKLKAAGGDTLAEAGPELHRVAVH
ncbi:hypothetical protein QTL95_06165 [Rhizobium sp. S152]|uniref:hypothetical protein n=1 Tax=Rhizobium sp. S152 TaxID=3055038 RepID=UPI0025AA0924|nr:hypothetical protein [Rhizobium sp. S152]MDM9625470.1 hypothetical protein [Rhizobium sp. S152]